MVPREQAFINKIYSFNRVTVDVKIIGDLIEVIILLISKLLYLKLTDTVSGLW